MGETAIAVQNFCTHYTRMTTVLVLEERGRQTDKNSLALTGNASVR